MDPQDQNEHHAERDLPKRWLDRHLWQIQPVRDLLVIAAVFGIFWLGYKLSVVTVPLLLAVTLAYVFEPLIKRMTRAEWMSRQGAAAAIIALMAAVVVVPLTIGLSFAAIQGIQLAGDVATQATAIKDAIDHPEDDLRQNRVQGRIPEWIRDMILDSRERERERLEELEARNAPVREDGSPITQPPEPETDTSEDPGPPDADGQDAEMPDEAVADASGAEPVDLEADPEAVDETYDGDAEPMASGESDGVSGPDEFQPSEAYIEGKSIKRTKRLPDDDFTKAMQVVLSWVERNAQAVTNRALATGTAAFDAFVRTVTSIIYVGFTLFLTAFFFFFISSGYGRFLDFSRKFIPDEHSEFTLHLLKRFDEVVSGFIRGRLTIAFIQSIVFSIGYWVIGVPAPVLLGVAVALLSIVPYAALVGIPVSIALLWLEERTGIRGSIMWTLGAPVGFYFLGQALDDYVWTPLIQGKSTGMDTPTILFATLAGGALMGVYGLLLAIPLAACIKILLQEIFWPRFQEWIAGKRPDFLPIDKG